MICVFFFFYYHVTFCIYCLSYNRQPAALGNETVFWGKLIAVACDPHVFYSRHEEDAVIVRAIVFGVLEKDFGLQWKLNTRLWQAWETPFSTPPMHDEFFQGAEIYLTCSFCNHNWPFHSKGISKPSKDLAPGATMICSQITRQTWFKDAGNKWHDREEVGIGFCLWSCCTDLSAALEHWNDIESLGTKKSCASIILYELQGCTLTCSVVPILSHGSCRFSKSYYLSVDTSGPRHRIQRLTFSCKCRTNHTITLLFFLSSCGRLTLFRLNPALNLTSSALDDCSRRLSEMGAVAQIPCRARQLSETVTVNAPKPHQFVSRDRVSKSSMERVVKLLTVADAGVCFWGTSRPTLSGGSGLSCPWDGPSDLLSERACSWPLASVWQHLCKEETHNMSKTYTAHTFLSLIQSAHQNLCARPLQRSHCFHRKSNKRLSSNCNTTPSLLHRASGKTVLTSFGTLPVRRITTAASRQRKSLYDVGT